MSIETGHDPRASLDRDLLRSELDRLQVSLHALVVHSSTTSTNADAAGLVAEKRSLPVLVVADEQTAGRGRLDRVWQAPRASSLLMTLAVHPDVPLTRWGWLPLLVGVAARRALEDEGAVGVALKWPNDLLAVDGRKLGGILCERTPDGSALMGIGINVDQSESELQAEQATSLRIQGGVPPTRERLCAHVVAEILSELARLEAAGGDAEAAGLAEEYSRQCSTLGLMVTVAMPAGESVVGSAVRIAATGGLVVDSPAGERELSAGDVVHVRPV